MMTTVSKILKNRLFSAFFTVIMTFSLMFASAFAATQAWFVGNIKFSGNITVEVKIGRAGYLIMTNTFNIYDLTGTVRMTIHDANIPLTARVYAAPVWQEESADSANSANSADSADSAASEENFPPNAPNVRLLNSPKWSEQFSGEDENTFFIYTGGDYAEKVGDSDYALIKPIFIDGEQIQVQSQELTFDYEITDLPENADGWTLTVVFIAEVLQATSDAISEAQWDNITDMAVSPNSSDSSDSAEQPNQSNQSQQNDTSSDFSEDITDDETADSNSSDSSDSPNSSDDSDDSNTALPDNNSIQEKEVDD